MMAGMTDPSIERERERLDLVIELVEAAILALPWDADPGLRASMERTLDEDIAKRARLDRA